MKNFLIIIILLFMQCANCVTKNIQTINNSKTQNISVNGLSKNILEHFDKIGKDNSIVLNNYEAMYFQEIIKDSVFGYNFLDKKICFFGPGGLLGSNKQEYFNSLIENKFRMECTLYIFDAVQKAENGGYDAAIVYWSKRYIPIEKIVERLKKDIKKQ